MAGKAGQPRARERIYLTFPKNLIKEPILSTLAKQFDVVFNIRGSTVTTEMALVAIELYGDQREVEKAISWLRIKGVTVEPIAKNVIE